ncbi:hypothetical protein ACHAPU_005490 [Fusarium lateritium]
MLETNTQVQLSDGVKLNVWLLCAENKSKPLIISLHGAPGLSTHSDFKEGFKFLADKFRVLVYDSRGNGSSEAKGPFTDEQWAADIDKLRAWVGEERFILIGGSYGGFIALNYAINFPHRLLSLILRNTWASGPLGTHRALANILSSRRINPDPVRQARLWSGIIRDRKDAEDSLSEIVKIYTPETLVEEKSEGLQFEGAGIGTELRWEVHNAAFSRNQPRFDVRKRLGEIKVPTLVVVGRLDVICPVEESETIAKAITNSELVIFEGSTHNPATDEPEMFRMVVSGFPTKLGM